MKPRYALLTLVLALTACQEPVVSDSEQSSTAGRIVDIQFSPRPGVPVEQIVNGMMATRAVLVSIFSDSEEGWQAKNSRLQAALAAAPDSTREMLEQAGAAQMLSVYLTDGDSDAQAAAAKPYVETLVRYETPEVPLVAESVERFAEAWGPEQTAVMAARAADAGDAYIDWLKDCYNCGPPARVARHMENDARQRGVADVRVAEAVQKLRELAQ